MFEFLKRLLARAEELHCTAASQLAPNLAEVEEGDVVAGVLPPELVGLAVAALEVRDAQQERCREAHERLPELKDDPERREEFDALAVEHARWHAEADFARDLVVNSINLHFPTLYVAKHSGLRQQDGQVVAVSSKSKKPEVPAFLQELAERFGVRAEVLGV